MVYVNVSWYHFSSNKIDIPYKDKRMLEIKILFLKKFKFFKHEARIRIFLTKLENWVAILKCKIELLVCFY